MAMADENQPSASTGGEEYIPSGWQRLFLTTADRQITTANYVLERQ